MGVEKNIRQKADRDFANEVLDAIRPALNGPFEGEAKTDAQRVAAALCFLRSQTLEYLRTVRHYPYLQRADHPRVRIAFEAYQMLQDIIKCNRHPIRAFFSGSQWRVQSKQALSRDFYKNSLLIACVKAITKANILRNPDETEAMAAMRRHPGLRSHVPPDNSTFRSMIYRNEDKADPPYKGQVRHYMDLMEFQQATTEESILVWTSMAMALREAPFDFAAATMIEDRGMVAVDADGNPVLIRPASMLPNGAHEGERLAGGTQPS